MRPTRQQSFYFFLVIAILLGISLCFGGDDNILWSELYHNDPQNYDPTHEFVPFESYTFCSVDPTGHVYSFTNVTIYILAAWMDLTSANVVYSIGGSDTYVPMSWVKNVTTSFHGQPSTTYDLWSATIPAHPVGTTVWYRIQVNDGSASAYLKTNNTWRNPLGQWVRNPDSPATDNYSYLVEDVPISVQLSQCTATQTGESTTIHWQTQNESNIAGFNILRSDQLASKFTRINQEMIANKGAQNKGASYSFVDDQSAGDECLYKVEIVKLDGTHEASDAIGVSTVTGIDNEQKTLSFALHQNYPNPFNSQTIIRYDLDSLTKVFLAIYDAQGRVVRILESGHKSPGRYAVKWDGLGNGGEALTSGLYLCRFSAGSHSKVRKIMFLK
jgi:hypothetical protein